MDDLIFIMVCFIVVKKKGIKVVYLVVGICFFDMDMLKEVNSMIIDGLFDYLFMVGMVVNCNLN